MKVLRAISAIAKKKGLYINSIMINEFTYATGQTQIPGYSETIGGLTFDEATGKVPLSKEKAEKYEFVIDPLKTYNFKDGFKFDETNSEHKAYLGLIDLHDDLVAKNKNVINRKNHQFYIEDKVKEADIELVDFENTLNAGNIIMNMNLSEKENFGRFLRVYKNDMSFVDNLSSSELTNKLAKYAKINPEIIIEFTQEDKKVWLKVTSFVVKDIITLKSGSYYEDNSYVANSLNSLISIYLSDPLRKARWDKKLDDLYGTVHKYKSELVPKSSMQEKEDALKESIMKLRFDDSAIIIKEIKSSSDEYAKIILDKYKDSIKAIEDLFKDNIKVEPKKPIKEDEKGLGKKQPTNMI
jgi:hypothetical protein